VRLTPSLPQRGMHPKGNPLDPRIVQNFQLTSPCPVRVRRGARATPKGGDARKIQKTSLVNHLFELNVKKLFEMLEFIQPSGISTEPKKLMLNPVTKIMESPDLQVLSIFSAISFKISWRNFSKWRSSNCSESNLPLHARRYTQFTIFSMT
jgi:hypothetical protein